MNDRKLYEQILGITEPWHVEQVELKLDVGQVLIRVEGSSTAEICPECGEPRPRYDAIERRWRHLDTCQYQTILIATVPRIKCDEHGVKQVRVPWSEERSRFTALFEALVIDWLQATENIAAVAKGMRLSWEEVAGIRSRAVARGMKRRGRAALPASVGVDETSITRGHEYITVVNALSEARVLDVIDERKEESLSTFWSQYSSEELAHVETVAMDMWPPYIASTRKHLSIADEKIVFDKFHIMKHLGEALDEVRKSEYGRLKGRDRTYIKGQKYTLLSHRENLTLKGRQALDKLLAANKRLHIAYLLKESFGQLWDYEKEGWARKFFENWKASLKWQRLGPYEKFARMIENHWEGIAAYCKPENKVPLGFVEGLNNKIRVLQRRAYGLRDEEYLRLKILTCMLPEI